MEAIRAWGGPLDGAVIPRGRNRAPLLWIEAETPHRVRLGPGPGRLLHIVNGQHARFAELTHVMCSGCGAVHARAEACVLCGTPRAPKR